MFSPEEFDRLKVPEKELNPVRKILGPGPANTTCKDCIFLERHKYGKVYLRCTLRTKSKGPATAHKAGWLACSKFEKEKEKGKGK